MIEFRLLDERMTSDDLGFLPAFFSEKDPRSAAEQLADNYAHGGGYSPLPGWKKAGGDYCVKYPGDEILRPLAIAKLHGKETLVFYKDAWLGIWQPTGDFVMTRVD